MAPQHTAPVYGWQISEGQMFSEAGTGTLCTSPIFAVLSLPHTFMVLGFFCGRGGAAVLAEERRANGSPSLGRGGSQSGALCCPNHSAQKKALATVNTS